MLSVGDILVASFVWVVDVEPVSVKEPYGCPFKVITVVNFLWTESHCFMRVYYHEIIGHREIAFYIDIENHGGQQRQGLLWSVGSGLEQVNQCCP